MAKIGKICWIFKIQYKLFDLYLANTTILEKFGPRKFQVWILQAFENVKILQFKKYAIFRVP